MVIMDNMKTMSFGDVREEYLRRENISTNYNDKVLEYVKECFMKDIILVDLEK